MKRAPRRVDFFRYIEDFQAAVLGAMGFSTAYIEEHTGLSPGQVLYRLRKIHVRRTDYRDGRSQLSLAILQRNSSFINQTVVRTIKTALPKSNNRRTA